MDPRAVKGVVLRSKGSIVRFPVMPLVMKIATRFLFHRRFIFLCRRYSKNVELIDSSSLESKRLSLVKNIHK